VDSIKLLQKEGVDLTKILDGGQSFLHVAAQLAENVAVLEYIYTNGCQQYLNRQDNWGWTPLHWSVVSQAAMSGSGKSRIANFSFLLSQGADPTIKAHESDIIPWGFLPWQEFTAIELAISIDPDLFKEVLDELRQQTPEAFTKENDPFHFKEINDKLINQYEDGNIEHMSDPNLG
jgi:ankyrin repeat protein